MDLKSDKTRTVIALVMARSWMDSSYKEKLVSHPREVLTELGLSVPEGYKLVVLTNTPFISYITLPLATKLTQDEVDESLAHLRHALPIREGHEVRLVQNTEKTHYIVLPAPPLNIQSSSLTQLQLLQFAVRPLDKITQMVRQSRRGSVRSTSPALVSVTRVPEGVMPVRVGRFTNPGPTALERSFDVCLVTMPYAALTRPSLALGLLKVVLEKEGIATTVMYPNVWFAEQVGIDLYSLCSEHSPPVFLAGEWSFAKAAFPDANLPDEEYLQNIHQSAHLFARRGIAPNEPDRVVSDLQRLREEAESFIKSAAQRVLETGARIVGCTSTFEQHVASLALLRQIRALDPSIITVMGGANCEAEMGEATHRYFPWVDYIVSGEAEGLIGSLFQRILSEGREILPSNLPEGVLGPRHRIGQQLAVLDNVQAPSRALFRDLDDLPIPDFSEYFETVSRSEASRAIHPGLPLETSRGCWWGMVHHCTFCGLNGGSMAYRSKSPARVISEIQTLERRHGISNFEAVDNILDMTYFKTLLPELAQESFRKIFYEVKSNLTRSQIEQLRQAGIIWIQPGIESLHTETLHLMDKGVQAWQNIQLLRWCRESGVRVAWNYLWGFPGERDEWYSSVAEWLPWLEHLNSPSGLVRLRYDRFSIYHQRGQAMGLDLQPISAMSFVYPLPSKDLLRLAYFFEDHAYEKSEIDLEPRGESHANRTGVKLLRQCIHRWRAEFSRSIPPVLAMNDQDGALRIIDSRRIATDALHVLTDLSRAICLIGVKAPVFHQLLKLIEADFGIQTTTKAIEEAVRELQRRKLILVIDGRIITLAIAGEVPTLPNGEDFPGGYIDF